MTGFVVQRAAARRIDEIFRYTEETWGRPQAEAYVHGLFDHFGAIAERRTPWRRIPAAFEVDGYFSRYGHHFIYWRERAGGPVVIVAVLHERMNLQSRFRDDFFGPRD